MASVAAAVAIVAAAAPHAVARLAACGAGAGAVPGDRAPAVMPERKDMTNPSNLQRSLWWNAQCELQQARP